MTNQRNNAWIPLINPIVTILVCVFFQIIYSCWGQVQPESTIDNSHETKQLMTMEKAVRNIRNENKKYKTMLDKATRRVDNLNKKFSELEKSFKTMTESNTGMREEIRRKLDNNSDKLSENGERIEQVNTDISNTRTDLEEKLCQQENNVNKTIQESNKEVSKMNDKIKKIEEEISSTSKTMTETITGMSEEIRRKIDINSDKLSENRKEIEQLNTDISNTRTDLEEKLCQQENNVNKTIQESNKEVSKMNDKLKKIQEEISITSETTKKAEEAITVLQNEIKKNDENRERIERLNTDISHTRIDLEAKMSSTSETIKKAEEARTLLQNEVKNINKTVAVLKANAFDKSVMMNLVVFLTTAVFALIIGMLIIWNRVSFDHHGNTPRHGSGTNPRMSVIEQVPNHPPLTNTICVISYGQTNESFNHTLVHKLMRQLSQPLQDTPVRGHLINTHADIANIPRCKLIFMCVEFSTRHVIIEEPGIGQGDIRRTTYDAVRKLGATLVILYTRDHESRQLGDKLRYQKDIYCVASQPELKVLDKQKCFYSVFNSFTQSQVESLETVIRRALQ